MKSAKHQWRPRLPRGREHKRVWKRVDNAANIFVATMTDLDTKVFRFSAELDDDVDPATLQRALDRVYDSYPLYHSVLRRGFFWYYLEQSNLRPVVQPDVLVPFDHLYHFDRRELLFRVVHHRRRLALEVFHVLSDGTGGWRFFRDLVSDYLRLRAGLEPAKVEPTPHTSLTADSFGAYFGSRAKRQQEAKPEPQDDKPKAKQRMFGADAEAPVLRLRGSVAPDRRNRLIEFTLPADVVLKRSKSQGISLTIYLVALYFEATRRSSPDIDRKPSIAITVPVNLRTHFPSESARNFFSVTRLEHTYGVGDDSIQAVAASLKAQLMPQIAKESLQAQVDKLLDVERHPIGRFIPRAVKDLALNVVNRINERALTLAMTGLGKLEFPDDVDDQVREVHLSVSTRRPQISVVTHHNWLTIGFTSPFVEMELPAAFAALLREEGIPVEISLNKVTSAELEEGTR